LRHIVPLIFVLSLISLAAASLVWPVMFFVFLGLAGAYLTAIAAAMLAEMRRSRGAHVVLLPVALMVLHFSYGLGSLYGAVLLARRAMRTASTSAELPS
jgi:hypothetical protein